MKKAICLLGLAIFLSCIGCDQAKFIVESKTTPANKIKMELLGNGEQLQKRGTINLHRKFTMDDNVNIDVWLINAAKKPTLGSVVVLHGTDESKSNYLGIGQNLAKLGYDTVLIDLRSHGRSDGKYITCGAKEKHDVKTIVDTLINEKKITAKPLYLFGVTFGGAVAIQYAAIEPNVAGLVAVAPWKDTYSMARRKLKLMKEDEFQATLKQAGKLADFDPIKTSAVKDAEELHCPVYLIHGLLDMAVPISDSKAIIAQVKGSKKLKIIMPGPEQLSIGIGWESWVPEQIDMVAKGKLNATPIKKDKPKPLKLEKPKPTAVEKSPKKPAAKKP